MQASEFNASFPSLYLCWQVRYFLTVGVMGPGVGDDALVEVDFSDCDLPAAEAEALTLVNDKTVDANGVREIDRILEGGAIGEGMDVDYPALSRVLCTMVEALHGE